MSHNQSLRCLCVLISLCYITSGGSTGPPFGTAADSPPARTEWPLFNGTLDNQRYSDLTEINRETVSRLQVKWTFLPSSSASGGAFECTPVVWNGLIYVTSSFCEVFALNAKTGSISWTYEPKILSSSDTDSDANHRGVAVAYGKVYLATTDCRLIALDAKTGEPVQSFGDKGVVKIADFKKGYGETSPPTISDGKVLIGMTGGEYPLRGFFSAYDANSGKLLWRWNTIPSPGERGGNTWPNNGSYKTGGGSAWMPAAVDKDRGLVIFGTGNPNPDFNGSRRAGDNLYTCCIVALDITTGKLRWHFQIVKHDLWDYDQAASPILFDVERDGTKIAAVGVAAKTGWFYILDRETGRSLLAAREVAVPQSKFQKTAQTQTMLDVPPFAEHRNIFTPPTRKGVLIAPGLYGGSEWSPVAYSPRTNLAYVTAIDRPVIFKSAPVEPVSKRRIVRGRMGGSYDSPANPSGKGAFVAVDVNTGLIKWRRPTVPDSLAGSLATGGGLVFTGEAEGDFIALEARTGERVWRFQCGASVNAAPMTFAAGGRQYIAVAVGGSGTNPVADIRKRYGSRQRSSAVFVFGLPDPD